jgi:UDP-N-acetylmuramate-alanine ligase
MTLPALKDIKKIYFVGIKGVGVAPLAMIANDAQIEIQGSDTGIEFITDLHLKDKGITIDVGFDVDTISSFLMG